jgi:putative ABC transport system permease protein
MKFIDTLTSALNAVWAHKMRSFLTMLGIIIGIFAVVALVSAGQGTNAAVTEQIEGLGSNLLTVNVRDSRADIDLNDVEMMERLTGIAAVSPYISSTYTVKNGSSSMEDIKVEGVTSGYQSIREYELDAGRYISSADNDNRLKTAVVGKDVAIELFSSLDIVGQSISIDGTKYEIIGVLSEQGDDESGSGDELIMIPFVTAQRQMKNTTISTIYASASSSDVVTTAQSGIESYMRNFTTDEDGYTVSSQESLLDSLSQVADSQTALLGSIAAISLLVGGIGIMNIMLVSVMERTREIGIEKAIGATRKDILLQFLIEAIIVSGIGGIIGVLLAQFGSGLVGTIMGTEVVVQMNIQLLAVGFSLVVGVGFGIYPAIKASKLNPIEALRYE